MSIPALTFRSSSAKCGKIPSAAPDVSLPGLAFAYETSSAIVLAGTAGLTTSAFESVAIAATATKSLIGSYSRFL